MNTVKEHLSYLITMFLNICFQFKNKYVYLCLSMYGCVHISESATRAQKRASVPGTGVSGPCELPEVGAGYWTQVFCKAIGPLKGWVCSPAPKYHASKASYSAAIAWFYHIFPFQMLTFPPDINCFKVFSCLILFVPKLVFDYHFLLLRID